MALIPISSSLGTTGTDGGVAGAAATWVKMYAPSNKAIVLDKIVVTNRSAVIDQASLYFRSATTDPPDPPTAPTVESEVLLFNVEILGNDVVVFEGPWVLNPGVAVWVFALNGTLTFHLFGRI